MTRSGRSPQRASRERNDVMHDVGMTDDDEHSLSDVFDGTVDPAVVAILRAGIPIFYE